MNRVYTVVVFFGPSTGREPSCLAGIRRGMNGYKLCRLEGHMVVQPRIDCTDQHMKGRAAVITTSDESLSGIITHTRLGGRFFFSGFRLVDLSSGPVSCVQSPDPLVSSDAIMRMNDLVPSLCCLIHSCFLSSSCPYPVPCESSSQNFLGRGSWTRRRTTATRPSTWRLSTITSK